MFIKIIMLTFICLVLNLQVQGKFLLLMGPSGAGKSTIIRNLKKLDQRFEYVTPLTTRELRANEQDKIHVSLAEMYKLEQAGQLLTINNIYGLYYATPKHVIDDSLAQGKFPILDWPIDKLEIMEKIYGSQLYKVYIQPDDLAELKRRLLQDNRDKDGLRYAAGVLEIEHAGAGKYDQFVDLKLINKKDCDEEIAQYIYTNFMAALKN